MKIVNTVVRFACFVVLATFSLQVAAQGEDSSAVKKSQRDTIVSHSVIDEVVWVVGDEAILKSDVETARMQALQEGVNWTGDPDCTIPEQLAVQKLFLNQADIDSTAGDVFKNTVGQTCLICRLWQNGAEVDPLKSTTYSTTAPSSPAAGDYYYQIQSSGPTTTLMRYSGSAWVDVTTDATYGHEKTYTWYRRDKDGNPMDSGAAFAAGKVIYVDGDDVTVKTVFVCEVE